MTHYFKKQNLYWELLVESLTTLTLNKLRTGLAILGIVIGIGSVIALMSLGQATQKNIQNQIQSLGSNLLTVMPMVQRNKGGNIREAFGSGRTLTLEDAEMIASSTQITTIKNVSPETQNRSQITTANNNTNTQVIGVTAVYPEVHKITIDLGNFITQRDVDQMTKVAVLGPQVVSDLFGEGINPIGKTLRINNQTFTIVGTTASKGGMGFTNQDDIVFVPITTAMKQLYGQNYLNSIALEAKSTEVMVQAQDEVGYFLMNRHKITDINKIDFSIMSQQDILNTAASTTNTFTYLLAGIAAISLVVGGIGIMNIMLVTVTERTREIGLRKALGAKKKIIILQFLIESIILTFSGGIIGICVGIFTSFIISKLTGSLFVVSLGSILLAFIVSTGIGILFGWYPAKRAANLEPIEALRYE